MGDKMFVAVLSDKAELRENFCKMMGSEKTKDEMSVYYSENKKIWFLDPTQYPHKIQPLLYSLSMADMAVVIIDGISPKIGEIIVTLNSMKIDRGIIVSNITLPISGTILEKYIKVTDLNAAKEKLLSESDINGSENTFGLINKTESVKSIGNVAHGTLKGGKLKKQDKLFILPHKKELEIRSISVNSKEVDELNATSGFEISYKGDLVERGLIAPLRNEFQIENIINGRFSKSPFFKDEIKGKIYAYSNMQFIEGSLNENDLTLLEPLAFEKGESIVVVDASNQKLRIAGVFQSKW